MSSNSNLFKEGIMAGFVTGKRHGKGKILRKIFKSNGTFNAKTDPETPCDGYNPVIIALDIMPKSVTENGTYIAEEDNLDGYNQVSVNVPAPVTELSVTKNGTYRAEAPNVGFNPVKVNVPSWEDAKKFYVDQSGTGEAGTGDSDYATELMNGIGYADYGLESVNNETGWKLTFEDGLTGDYPENGWTIHLRNDALGRDLIVAAYQSYASHIIHKLDDYRIDRSGEHTVIRVHGRTYWSEWRQDDTCSTISGVEEEAAWNAYLAQGSTCTVIKQTVSAE